MLLGEEGVIGETGASALLPGRTPIGMSIQCHSNGYAVSDVCGGP